MAKKTESKRVTGVTDKKKKQPENTVKAEDVKNKDVKKDPEKDPGETAKDENINPENVEKQLNEKFSEYVENTQKDDKKENEKSSNEPVSADNTNNYNNVSKQDIDTDLMSGYGLILIIDTFIPLMLHKLVSLFYNVDFEPDQVQLTNDEIDKLENLANKAASYLLFRANPVVLFSWVLISMYSKKIMSAGRIKKKR